MTWSNDDPTDLNHEPPTFTLITEYEREQRSQRNEMPDEEFNIHNDIADRNWETIRMWEVSIREYQRRMEELPVEEPIPDLVDPNADHPLLIVGNAMPEEDPFIAAGGGLERVLCINLERGGDQFRLPHNQIVAVNVDDDWNPLHPFDPHFD